MKKYLSLLTFFACWVVLSGCTNSAWSNIDLPDIFASLPDWFDQLMYVQVDDQIIDLVELQYWEQSPIALEFEKIESLVLWQTSAGDAPYTMLAIDPVPQAEIDTNQLAVLWLTAGAGYEFRSLGDLQMYAETSFFDNFSFAGVQDHKLLSQIQPKDLTRNVVFVSLPISGQTWRVAQFANRLQWTIVSADIGTSLPIGLARLIFDDWFVPDLSGQWDWTSTIWSPDSPIHLSAHSLSSLFGIQARLLESFLPILLPQFVWGSLSLLSADDYKILSQALWGVLSLDMVPSPAGRWGRLSIADPKVYWLFEKIYPALDDFITSWPSQDATIASTKQQSRMTWMTSFDAGGENVTLPLLDISRDTDATTIEYLMLSDLDLAIDNTNKNSYPPETLAVWSVDFATLSSIVPALWVIWWSAQSAVDISQRPQLQLEIISDPQSNQIRIEFDD